jgi:elongation factor G
MSSCINFDLKMLGIYEVPIANSARWVTLVRSVSGKGRWVRQTCCSGYAFVEIRLEPYRGPNQFQLVWQVMEEQIPEEFLPGVVEGIYLAALQERPSPGPLTNIRVIVTDGAYHPVDSSRHAFGMATLKAFEDALAKTELVPVE